MHFEVSKEITTYGAVNLLLINSVCMDFSSPEMQRRLIHTKVYYNFALSEKKQSLLSSACIILKKPSRGVLRKRCSENTQQIYRRNTHAELKSHFRMAVLL